jgi:hypothetical protein
MPHALNPRWYYPLADHPRTIDIGFIGALYHSTIGDLERSKFVTLFTEICPKLGLRSAIGFENIPRAQWSEFLRSSKAIIGAESGTYYLQRSGEGVRKALKYQKEHPQAGFQEVFSYAFEGIQSYVNGKCISSRHFEPIGTKTVQILLEGEYNGILKPDEHYIPVRKDFSNLEEALKRFSDTGYREAMAERAFKYVMENHTYGRRVRDLAALVSAPNRKRRGLEEASGGNLGASYG